MSEPSPTPVAARRSRFAALPAPLRAAAWMVTGALLAVLVVAGAGAVAWSLLEQRPEWVAGWLGDRLGREVRIGEMALSWRGSGPVVRLLGLSIDTGDPSTPTLTMQAAELRVDALGSLRDGALRPRSVTVRGAALDVYRDADGGLALAGLGLDGAARADAVLGAILSGLPVGAVLALEETRVALRASPPAAGGPAPIVLEPVSLSLRALPRGLRLSGALAPHAHPGATLRFSLRWDDAAGNPLDAADLTLSSRRLPLAALSPTLVPRAVAGELDLDVDGRVEAGALASMRGTAVLREARLVTPGGGVEADTVETLVDFDRQADGWVLALLRTQVHTARRVSSPTAVRVIRRHAAPDGRYVLHVGHLPVATALAVARVAGVDGGAADLLRAVKPRGQAHDVELTVQRTAASVAPLSLAAALKGVVVETPGAAARLGPADALLAIDARGGRLELQPSPASFTAAGGGTVELAAGGSLAWRAGADGIELTTDGINLASGSSRLRVTGGIGLRGAEARLAQVSVSARGADFDARQVKAYLGALNLPGGLAGWLDGALLAGRLSSIDLDAHGTPEELSSLAAVTVHGQFDGAELEYAPGWPRLENLSGALGLDGARFEVVLDRGTVAGARIETAKAVVADVTAAAPRVTVAGRARGLTQQGAAFVAGTPMAGRFAGLLAQFDARGEASLTLALGIPLDDAATEVDGVVDLVDNTLKVGALRSAMDTVSGRIHFDRQGLRDGTLEAAYLGRRISARIDGTRGNRERTLLTIDGTTDPRGLVQHLHDLGALDHADPRRLSLLSRLSGTTRWQVLLDVAQREPLAGDGIALTVRSDLEGMALELPAPLGKRASERRELEIHTQLTEPGPRLFRVRYGADLAALLERDASTPRAFRLRRGDVRFGAPPSLPEYEGLRVAGELDLLSVDDWVGLVAEATGDATGTGGPLERVREVDISVRRLVALGAGFDGVRVRVTRDGEAGLRIAAVGEAVDGTIHVPVPVGREPIDARFKTLRVSPASGRDVASRQRDTPLDPRSLPDAHIVAERLAYGDVELGLAKVVMRRTATGVELTELYTLNQNFELRGSGSWTGDGRRTRSMLDLRIHSTDFGRLTGLLGYGDSGAEGGVADVSLAAHWRGTPFDFGLERVRGELHFRATEGRLRDVEPGATGRVFGLLNVTVLPRRLLRLDFKDLFEEGIRYDLIEGSFRLDAGNAWSDDISMHTKSARIDLRGRVGLVAEDYDQTMTVTPKLSASLPLAPLWLAEKLLNRKFIDSAFAYRYVITGSWDDPQVERVRVKAERSDAG